MDAVHPHWRGLSVAGVPAELCSWFDSGVLAPGFDLPFVIVISCGHYLLFKACKSYLSTSQKVQNLVVEDLRSFEAEKLWHLSPLGNFR